MSACEYSIAELNHIKKALITVDGKKQEVAWTIGGLIITLTATLLRTCNEVIADNKGKDNPNALEDIREIQKHFNGFIDGMVDNG